MHDSSNEERVNRSIPFFNYPALFQVRADQYIGTIEAVVSRGAFIMQAELAEFEASLADFVGVRHAVGVGNGTDAILIGLRACGLGPGDEVIMPSHTFVATGSAVHHCGARPVLVDISDDHMLDPAAVESAITARTSAIIPVQLNGRVCDMDALARIADKYDLVLFEDAAQGLGSRFGGTRAGAFGKAASFSFYPAKLLGCFGDGGAVVTDDDDVAARVRRLRDHGRTDNGDVFEWSLNSRLDTIHAAVLSLKLRYFDADIMRRRALAAIYEERLGGLRDLRLPPGPDAPGPHFDVYQNYEIETSRRDGLRTWLSAEGVGTVIQWGGRAVHQFSGLPFPGVSLPRTEALMRDSLLLPMNTSLNDEDIAYVCDSIEAFYASCGDGCQK